MSTPYRICPACNNPIPESANWQAKYCSLRCRDRAAARRRRNRERGIGSPAHAHLPQVKELITKPDAPMPQALDAHTAGIAERLAKTQEEVRQKEREWKPDLTTIWTSQREGETDEQTRERLIAEHRAKLAERDAQIAALKGES